MAGDYIMVEIRDSSHRVLYRKKFDIRDTVGLLNFIGAYQKFCGISVYLLLKSKAEIGEFF
jgi:hypothetical protein